ncbi:MAG: hypothetical protein AB1626_01925 [Candidatus Micrarchaeota archaeon]
MAKEFKARDINVKQLELKLRYAVKTHGAEATARAVHEVARDSRFDEVLPAVFRAAAKTKAPEFKAVLQKWFENSGFSRHAAEGLAEYGQDVAPYFAAYASKPHHEPSNRITALKKLAQIDYANPASAADVVSAVARTAATDGNYLVRKTALETTREITTPDLPPETLADATEWLLSRTPKQEDEILIHQMALSRVLSCAQHVLRLNKTEEANRAAYRIADAVSKATAKPDDFVRGLAATVLGHLEAYGGRYANTLGFIATNPATSESVRRDAAAALASVAEYAPSNFRKKIAEDLAKALPDEENPLTAASMAQALHKLGEAGQEKLWQLFHHPSEAGRIAAYWVGRNPVNTSQLLTLLHDKKPLLQARAAAGLGSLRFAPPKVDAELALAATDEDRALEVRKEAARSLVLRGKPGVAKKLFSEIERVSRPSRISTPGRKTGKP